nr:MAG TPA: Frataxin-like domain [Caudoviricetes sp.]
MTLHQKQKQFWLQEPISGALILTVPLLLVGQVASLH